MDFKSLRARLLFFFASLLILVQLAAWYLMNTSATQISNQYNDQKITDAQLAIERYFIDKEKSWLDYARLITEDSLVQAAFRTNNQTMLRSQLEQYREQLDISYLALTPVNTVSTLSGFSSDGKGLYHLVSTPFTTTPQNILLKVGNKLDNATASELRHLTGLQLSFVQQSDHGITLFGSSRMDAVAHNNKESRDQLSSALIVEYASLLSKESNTQKNAYLKGLAIPLGAKANGIYAILQPPPLHSESALSELRRNYTLLVAFSLLLALNGGILISRVVTRPLGRLADFAKEIQMGNYAKTVEIERKDEIGELAYTLNVMNQSIALREEEMLHMAYSDTLTGLPNRAMFNDRLNKAVCDIDHAPTPFSIMMIDLDRFKFINDVLGHDSGDYALRIVAKRLQSVLRKSDTVARLGGDEFGVILPTGNRNRVEDIAKKILRALEEPIAMESQHVDLGGSIGIACYPVHATEASTLMRYADVAMYEAKRSGIGHSFFDQDSDAHKQTHLSLLGDIRKALSNNEFELYYQPKVALIKSDKPNLEVLIRWNHPERGFIPPEEFIPFAEHTGSIRLITHWVIDNAITQCGQWLANGDDVKIAINVSSRDLLNPNLSDIVEKALIANKLPPSNLCLEITESALMDDPDKARAMVMRLYGLGVRISIDDYGTGYSSLAYVANLPVGELKIDRTFVSNMLESMEDCAIVRSTIELGHYLQMDVVAEGIEQKAEMDRLREFGCDYIQGYLICKPLRSSEVLGWLSSRQWEQFASDNKQPAPLLRAAND